MLSDRDRQVLTELERALCQEDLQLVSRFAPVPRPSRWRRYDWLFSTVLGSATLLSSLAVLFGAPRQAAGFATLAVFITFMRYGPRVAAVLRPTTSQRRTSAGPRA
jgi:hypothetical protein